jgi:hypothetical protein
MDTVGRRGRVFKHGAGAKTNQRGDAAAAVMPGVEMIETGRLSSTTATGLRTKVLRLFHRARTGAAASSAVPQLRTTL